MIAVLYLFRVGEHARKRVPACACDSLSQLSPALVSGARIQVAHAPLPSLRTRPRTDARRHHLPRT